ncbi:hypothetical protein Tco_0763091 [Tanacetum coccineum]
MRPNLGVLQRPFCRKICVKARRFDGMITIYKGNDSVTYQMARHSRFKHLTNAQCNKMRPLLKVSAQDELKGSDIGSPGVDRLPRMLEDPYVYVESALQAPPSLDYVPGPEHPASPDYVPGPEEPEQAPIFLEYVPEPEHPDPITGLRYVADFDLEEDQDDDSEEDHTDYPVDGGDDDDDDDDDDESDEEEEESSKDDDEEEEEHLAPVDSALPDIDLVPSARDTEAFETDEYAATPPSPLAYRTTSRLSFIPQTPIPFPPEAEVARLLALPTPPPSPLSPWSSPLPQFPSPPLHVSSPPLPLPSPPPTSPTYTEAHLGYRGAGLRLRAALPPPFLPSIAQRKESLEADLPLWKRLCMTALTGRFKIGESSTATAARYVEPALARDDLYRFANTVDAAPGCSMSREVGYGITNT